MKKFVLSLVVVFVSALCLTSCGSKSGSSDGYSRSELFGKSTTDVSVNNYMKKFFLVSRGEDGKLYLGNPRFEHKISDMMYANTEDPVKQGDKVKVWKKGDRFFLLRADPQVPVFNQATVLDEWARENLSDEVQKVESDEPEIE